MRDAHTVVFGGTGFLGRAIVRELVEAGRSVRIAARHPKLPEWLEAGDRVEAVACDLRNKQQVVTTLEGSGAVINAVSLYVERPRSGLTFEEIHVTGAGQLARLAREAGVTRLVHVSGIGTTDTSPSAYVRARAAGERAVIDALPKAVILRPSVLFGPGDAFLAALMRLAQLPVMPLFGRGNTLLQPVHVADVARASVSLSDMRPLTRRLFELGGPEVLRYRQVVEQVLAHLECRRPLMPMPFPIWRLTAAMLAPLPNPPLTRDQVILMQQDTIVSDGVGTFNDLGIVPRTLHDSLPTCLTAP
ncbi:complex I NDUFA9 subunit family protein [Halomonas sp.]|uniref:complex I NDUFA9 subunit family protein n=1 Tax=Halomonas sp. TaxID=1486246 RepID=UPI00384CD2C9